MNKLEKIEPSLFSHILIINHLGLRCCIIIYIQINVKIKIIGNIDHEEMIGIVNTLSHVVFSNNFGH